MATVLALVLAVAACGGGSDSSSSAPSGGESQPGGESGPDGGSKEASIKAPTTLTEDGKLTVCTDPTYPPDEYYGEDKELTGFSIESAKATAEKMGLEATFIPTQFNGILPALDSGRCDVAWSSIFINAERIAKYTAVPYQETASVIMVKGGNPDNITSPEDLSGKTVASENGAEVLELAREISKELEAEGKQGAEVQGYNKFEEAVQQLALGRADAVTTQDVEAAFRELKQPGEFESVYRFPDAETFGVYMEPSNKELAQGIYKGLKELEEEGALKKIAEEQGMPTVGIGVKPPVGP